MTLQDLGLTFTYSDDCTSCTEDGECHSQRQCKKDGKNYHIHVMADVGNAIYTVTIQSMEENDNNENPFIKSGRNSEIAQYLHDRFGFKCE